MDDDLVAQFVGITSSTPERAEQYLRITEHNLEQAIQLYFDSGGVDLGGTPTPAASAPGASAAVVDLDDDLPPPNVAGVKVFGGRSRDAPIEIDDSDEDEDATARRVAAAADHDDDEAMARRLQEEMYAGAESSDGVRAPIERRTETLVGPEWGMDEGPLNMMRMRANRARPGIFNQRGVDPSVWDDDSVNERQREEILARATGGASQRSTKSSMLAEMYRPPFELISTISFDSARTRGRERGKWILVNVQDPAIFDCQVLNRDIWKNAEIKETVKTHFIFLQYSKDDPSGQDYIQYYFQDKDQDSAYPYIAIVDPRTGEQVKTWSGPPGPKPHDFLMALLDFLDRYSLADDARNPVAKRKPVKKDLDVARMSEEEQLRMAMQNSLETTNGPAHQSAEDPDDLTKSIPDLKGKGKAESGNEEDEMEVDEPASAAASEPSQFSLISSNNPHTEPAMGPTITRMQFRHPGGRPVVRRFELSDPVRRIFEWLKAEPLSGLEGKEFGLVMSGKNLIEHLDTTIEEAGLRNSTINVEALE